MCKQLCYKQLTQPFVSDLERFATLGWIQTDVAVQIVLASFLASTLFRLLTFSLNMCVGSWQSDA